MLLSASDAASAMPLQTDSIGLALPVAFGCHGSRKNEAKWKHLASRCRNLTVQFSFLVWEPALVAVTGRGRGGDSVFSSFKHLGVGLTCDDWKGTGPVLLSLPHSCCVSGSVLGEHAAVLALLCVEGKLLFTNTHFVSSRDFPSCPLLLPPPGLERAQILSCCLESQDKQIGLKRACQRPG